MRYAYAILRLMKESIQRNKNMSDTSYRSSII